VHYASMSAQGTLKKKTEEGIPKDRKKPEPGGCRARKKLDGRRPQKSRQKKKKKRVARKTLPDALQKQKKREGQGGNLEKESRERKKTERRPDMVVGSGNKGGVAEKGEPSTPLNTEKVKEDLQTRGKEEKPELFQLCGGGVAAVPQESGKMEGGKGVYYHMGKGKIGGVKRGTQEGEGETSRF